MGGRGGAPRTNLATAVAAATARAEAAQGSASKAAFERLMGGPVQPGEFGTANRDVAPSPRTPRARKPRAPKANRAGANDAFNRLMGGPIQPGEFGSTR